MVLTFFLTRPPTEDEVAANANILDPAEFRSLRTVRTLVPQTTQIAIRVSVTGSFVSRTEIDLASQIGGRIAWVSNNLRDGASFNAGERLLEIDKTDFQINVERAKADLETAEANLKLTEAQSEASIKSYGLLYPNTEIPALVAMKPQLAQSQAAIKIAKARIVQAELDLSRTDFSLPFSGHVLRNSAAVGQLITPGNPFATAISAQSLEAEFPVTRRDLDQLEPVIGRTVFSTYRGQRYEGEVERVSATLDTRSRVATLYVAFEDTSPFEPGAFLEATIEGPTVDNVYVLPDNTIQGENTVWIVQDDRLKMVMIEILAMRDSGFVVEAFPVGEGIVVGRLPRAEEDLRVVSRPVEE